MRAAADVLADLLHRTGDGAHRDHDAQHRRHDADARQRVTDLLQRGGGLAGLLVVNVHLAVHQGVEIVGGDAADQHQAEGVAQECHGMVLVQHLGVLLEDGTLLRVLDVGLDRHQAVFPRHLKQLVEHPAAHRGTGPW